MSIGDFENDCHSKPTEAFIVVGLILREVFYQLAGLLVLNTIVGKAFLLVEELVEEFTMLD